MTVSKKEANDLRIENMLVVSPQHIKEETRNALDEAALNGEYETTPFDGLSVYPFCDCGWLIYTKAYVDKSAQVISPAQCGMEDLDSCIKFAYEHGCDYLCITYDGPEVKGLRMYAA